MSMMVEHLTLPYGRDGGQLLTISSLNYAGTLVHREPPPGVEAGDLAAALARPVACRPLQDIVHPGERVAIVTSDVTRPCPTKIILPPILKELQLAGVNSQDISIILATGNHRSPTEDEKRYLLGEQVYDHYRSVDAAAGDMVYLGQTSRCTPVEVFRPVVEADRRILIGNVEYHYFAGYSGGAKAIMPGCASPRSIQANHRLMVDPAARAGSIATNPVRQDIDEVLNFLPVDFIVNVVLDEDKNILAAFVGHPLEAHRQAARYLDAIYQVEIKEQADIVIASAGGYPKDLNLYQAQKALDNARRAVRPGGVLILVAECPEGLGDATFARWIAAASQPRDLIDRIQVGFELGGHKAAAIAMAVEDIQVYLVSSLPGAIVRQCFLEPCTDLVTAYQKALAAMGPAARVLVIPQAGSVLPRLATEVTA
ncbi:MAG: lactate racemase [Clostridia bacterium]|nr:lactate racemase [Clostridia bacterium]